MPAPTKWLSVIRSRVRGKAGAGRLGARGRMLAFERCESRIALSAVVDAELTTRDESLASPEGGGIPTTFIQSDGVVFGASDTTTIASNGLTDSAFADADLSLSFTGSFDSTLVDSFGVFIVADAGTVEFRTLAFGASRIQPIAPPATGQGNVEGGRISLAAYAGVAGLGVAGASESLAMAEAELLPRPSLSEPAATPGRLFSAEPLRSRAVIYDVAQAAAPAAQREAPRQGEALVAVVSKPLEGAAALRGVQAAPEPAAAVAATATSPAPVAIAHREQALHLREYHAAIGDRTLPIAGDSDASAQLSKRDARPSDGGDSGARDEAFAWWDGDSEHADDERQALAPGERSAYRAIGAAIAVSLAAGPVRRAIRRSVRADGIEQRPPQRRRGAFESL